MRRIRTLVAVGLVLALVGTVLTGSASAAKGKKGNRPVGGTVASVTPESVVVKVRRGKKKGGEAVEQTFQLNGDTKFEFVTITRKKEKGEKPEMETKPATLSDLKAGERVQITNGASAVEKVSIVQGGRKGKNKAD